MKKEELWERAMHSCDLLCHQRPDRSFFFGGYQSPVCARCCGVALGESVGLVYVCIGTAIPWLFSVICVAAMGLDWVLQATRVLESTNTRRLITGTLGGFGLIESGHFLLSQYQ